jgi:hypothetical protein
MNLYFAVSTAANDIQIYSLSSFTLLKTLTSANLAINTKFNELRFSADGQYLAGVTAYTLGFSSVVVVKISDYTLQGATVFNGA